MTKHDDRVVGDLKATRYTFERAIADQDARMQQVYRQNRFSIEVFERERARQEQEQLAWRAGWKAFGAYLQGRAHAAQAG